MKLEQSFEVAAPLERVWQTLIDVEHVAPCLPGAAVTGRNDDGSYNGTFTVKIGPTTASYTGRLEMESIDEGSHTATMQAQGTDKRGQGGAKATIYSRLAPGDGRGTRVEVVTDYHITGRLARFGRGGMIEDISERLLREFAKRLQSSLAAEPDAAAEPVTAAPEPERAGAADTLVSPAPATPAAAAPGAPETSAAAAPGTPAAAAPEMPPAMAAGTPEAPVSPTADIAPETPAPARHETTFTPAPIPSAPPGAPVSPAADVTPPPPPPAPPAPASPGAGAQPAGDAPAPPPPPSPGPPPVATPPPAPSTPSPGAAGRPPLEHPPEPSEPMQGLSLVGGVLWGRVKRNPAPAAAAAGVAVVLLMARRRRRRSGWS